MAKVFISYDEIGSNTVRGFCSDGITLQFSSQLYANIDTVRFTNTLLIDYYNEMELVAIGQGSEQAIDMDNFLGSIGVDNLTIIKRRRKIDGLCK